MTDTSKYMEEFKYLDHIPCGLMVLRDDYSVLYWNKCLEDWTNVKSAMIVGKPIFDKFINLRDKKFMHRLGRIFLGAPVTVFSSLLHKHIIPSPLFLGKLRSQSAVAAPIASGKLGRYHALVSIQDVTSLNDSIDKHRQLVRRLRKEVAERKRAEEESKKFQELINRSNDSIAIIDPETGVYVYANDKLCDSLGYARDEFKDIKIADIYSFDSEDYSWSYIMEELKVKDFLILNIDLKRKNGTTFPVEININNVFENNQRYLVEVVRDLSERKHMEDRLKKNINEVERFNKMTVTREVTMMELRETVETLKARLREVGG